MSRYHEADVKSAIKTELDSDFNTMIATIRAERSDSTIPLAKNITYDTIKNQYPEIYIDITESELQNDSELTTDIDVVPEVFIVEITAMIKTQITSAQSYADYYNEALKRVLHGYNDSSISWILVTNTIQMDFTEEKTSQNFKMCGVTCQVYVP